MKNHDIFLDRIFGETDYRAGRFVGEQGYVAVLPEELCDGERKKLLLSKYSGQKYHLPSDWTLPQIGRTFDQLNIKRLISPNLIYFPNRVSLLPGLNDANRKSAKLRKNLFFKSVSLDLANFSELVRFSWSDCSWSDYHPRMVDGTCQIDECIRIFNSSENRRVDCYLGKQGHSSGIFINRANFGYADLSLGTLYDSCGNKTPWRFVYLSGYNKGGLSICDSNIESLTISDISRVSLKRLSCNSLDLKGFDDLHSNKLSAKRLKLKNVKRETRLGLNSLEELSIAGDITDLDINLQGSRNTHIIFEKDLNIKGYLRIEGASGGKLEFVPGANINLNQLWLGDSKFDMVDIQVGLSSYFDRYVVRP